METPSGGTDSKGSAAESASDLEPEGTLSATEQRVEEWRRRIGIILGPALFLLLLFIPIPSLGPRAHHLTAILGLVLTFWLTEAIPIPATALLGTALMPLLGVASAKESLAPFADPIVFLFIGSFIMARAMSIHGLDRRFAFSILSLRWVTASPGRILLVFGLTTAAISMWVSNTATAAMMLPIGLGILRVTSGERGGALSTYGTGMMLMIAYAASIGGLGTPVGSPPNLIGIAMIENLEGTQISFFRWMTLAMPILLLMFGLLFLLLRRLHGGRRERQERISEYVRAERARMGPWSAGERNTLIAFSFAATLWVIPGVMAVLTSSESAAVKTYHERLPEGIVAVLAASLLFLLPTSWKKREFTLVWREAARIDWGTILLFGGGLSLGAQMFATGLADTLGSSLLALTGTTSVWGLTAMAIALAIVISEATSNTASANMVIPVVIAIAKSLHVSPIPPALGACMGASFGFMLPVSTPPNAIVYGTGLVPITRMVRAGVLIDLLGFLVVFGALRVLCPLLNFE